MQNSTENNLIHTLYLPPRYFKCQSFDIFASDSFFTFSPREKPNTDKTDHPHSLSPSLEVSTILLLLYGPSNYFCTLYDVGRQTKILC